MHECFMPSKFLTRHQNTSGEFEAFDNTFNHKTLKDLVFPCR